MRDGPAFQEAKIHAVAEFWARRKEPTPSGELGGRGYPDPEMLPFCDWLNAFEGMYTEQSCAGHRALDGHVVSQGTVWVRLDCERLDLFRRRACEFAGSPFVDRIQSIYLSSGEFVEIIFSGNESGQLLESLAALREFFGSLVISRGKP